MTIREYLIDIPLKSESWRTSQRLATCPEVDILTLWMLLRMRPGYFGLFAGTGMLTMPKCLDAYICNAELFVVCRTPFQIRLHALTSCSSWAPLGPKISQRPDGRDIADGSIMLKLLLLGMGWGTICTQNAGIARKGVGSALARIFWRICPQCTESPLQ